MQLSSRDQSNGCRIATETVSIPAYFRNLSGRWSQFGKILYQIAYPYFLSFLISSHIYDQFLYVNEVCHDLSCNFLYLKFPIFIVYIYSIA